MSLVTWKSFSCRRTRGSKRFLWRHSNASQRPIAPHLFMSLVSACLRLARQPSAERNDVGRKGRRRFPLARHITHVFTCKLFPPLGNRRLHKLILLERQHTRCMRSRKKHESIKRLGTWRKRQRLERGKGKAKDVCTTMFEFNHRGRVEALNR